jgi:L-lactate dehydrogenase complex protein LldG
MSDAREIMLARVRDAVAAGNEVNPGTGPIPERGDIGYQGGGPDLVAQFLAEVQFTGLFAHAVANVAEAATLVTELLRKFAPKLVLVGRWNLPGGFDADALVRRVGATVLDAATPTQPDALPQYATADVGVTGCDYLIAETGSVVVLSKPEQARSLSLLPPFHIVIATAKQILPDVFDVFALSGGPPSGMAIITGPSKTGDIEGKLVTGVHGPREVHVVVVRG